MENREVATSIYDFIVKYNQMRQCYLENVRDVDVLEFRGLRFRFMPIMLGDAEGAIDAPDYGKLLTISEILSGYDAMNGHDSRLISSYMINVAAGLTESHVAYYDASDLADKGDYLLALTSGIGDLFTGVETKYERLFERDKSDIIAALTDESSDLAKLCCETEDFVDDRDSLIVIRDRDLANYRKELAEEFSD